MTETPQPKASKLSTGAIIIIGRTGFHGRSDCVKDKNERLINSQKKTTI